ncbi:hypothetical protein [Micrococcus lylae]|nr:hypothetical protein [Micrococcus lylae]
MRALPILRSERDGPHPRRAAVLTAGAVAAALALVGCSPAGTESREPDGPPTTAAPEPTRDPAAVVHEVDGEQVLDALLGSGRKDAGTLIEEHPDRAWTDELRLEQQAEQLADFDPPSQVEDPLACRSLGEHAAQILREDGVTAVTAGTQPVDGLDASRTHYTGSGTLEVYVLEDSTARESLEAALTGLRLSCEYNFQTPEFDTVGWDGERVRMATGKKVDGIDELAVELHSADANILVLHQASLSQTGGKVSDPDPEDEETVRSLAEYVHAQSTDVLDLLTDEDSRARGVVAETPTVDSARAAADDAGHRHEHPTDDGNPALTLPQDEVDRILRRHADGFDAPQTDAASELAEIPREESEESVNQDHPECADHLAQRLEEADPDSTRAAIARRTVSFEGVRKPPQEMVGLLVAPDMESAAAWEGLLLHEIQDRCGDLRNRGSGDSAGVPVDVDGARFQKALAYHPDAEVNAVVGRYGTVLAVGVSVVPPAEGTGPVKQAHEHREEAVTGPLAAVLEDAVAAGTPADG